MASRSLQPDCSYTVQRGDFQAVVARDFNVTTEDLRAANPGASWIEGARWVIPGHECLLVQPVAVPLYGTYGNRNWGGWGRRWSGGHSWGGGGTHGGGHHSHGMHGLGDIDTWSIIPATPVQSPWTVQITVDVGNLSSATRSVLERDVYQSLARYWQVRSVTSGLFGYAPLTVTLQANAPTSLRAMAHAVWIAVAESATGAVPGTINAQITAYTGVSGLPDPTGATPSPTTVPAASVASTTVYPGDQVKVWAQASWPNLALAQAGTTANLASRGYAVLNFDGGGGFSIGAHSVYILVSPAVITNLGTIAMDANWAMSAAGMSVNQNPPPYATIYSRGAGIPLPPGSDGVPRDPAGNPRTAPKNSDGTDKSILDQIADALGASTGLPLTGAIVAVVAGIVILIAIKT